MENKDQISESVQGYKRLVQDYKLLRDKLNKSQRKLRITKIVSASIIIFLLILCMGSSGSSTAYKDDFEKCKVLLQESQANFRIMKTQVDTLKAKVKSLEDEIEESEFYFYYDSVAEQRFGVDDLESYLDRWQWTEGSYVRGKFDCSEMSAYIERNLENEGYRTWIVIGDCPFNQSARHAWLLVETSPGKSMPVEATRYALVKWDNPYFDLYFEYDHSFGTIFDALEYDYDDFNWWET